MKKLITSLAIVLISLASFGQVTDTIKESSAVGFFEVNGVDYLQGHFGIRYSTNRAGTRLFSLYNIHDNKDLISARSYSNIYNVSSWDSLYLLLNKVGALANNDVAVQDQTTPLIIAKFSNEEANTTLEELAVLDSSRIKIDDATGFGANKYMSIFSVPDNRFFLANVLSISGDTLTLDTPLDFAYPVGSIVTSGVSDMAVDGSGTRVIYGVRNTDVQIGSEFDIVRIIIHCETATSIDLSKFGDIAGGLTKGIVMRKVDGETRNIFNAKTNGELKNLMYDFDIQLAAGNQQDGFTGRMTFGGWSKMGAVIRLKQGEDLQIIIQDNLSSLELLEIIVEGHLVEY